MDSRFDAALRLLGSQLGAAQIDRTAYYQSLARLLHGRFRPTRVNIWRLTPRNERPGRVLERLAGYDPSPLAAPSRADLSESEFGPYLAVLASQGVYVSGDALADPALEPMRAGYLAPSLVAALMDAAISINGVIVGVVCCEQIGRTRVWTQPEITAMRRAISTVNVYLARLAADDARAGEEPG